MKIDYIKLNKRDYSFQFSLRKVLKQNLKTGEYINGRNVATFEKKFSKFIGTRYAVGVSSGHAALYLVLKYLNLKKTDEVITVSHSYLASVSSIVLSNIKPVLCDIGDDLVIDETKIAKLINKNTKAIMLVHLGGMPCNLNYILKLCRKYNLRLIEDCSQAAGSTYNKKKVGSFGNFGCFSLHPLKNLGALGDAGIITTDSKKAYFWLIKARNHGHSSRDECDFWSHNMRLDNLQAGFLLEKLKKLSKIIIKRRKIAHLYNYHLKNLVTIPNQKRIKDNTYHTYIIQTNKRNKLKKFLKKKGIETAIHYPKPIHKLKAFKNKLRKFNLPATEFAAKRILSLPIGEYLKRKEVLFIIKNIKFFFEKYNLIYKNY